MDLIPEVTVIVHREGEVVELPRGEEEQAAQAEAAPETEPAAELEASE
jgi:hypothetical protein